MPMPTRHPMEVAASFGFAVLPPALCSPPHTDSVISLFHSFSSLSSPVWRSYFSDHM